MYDSPIHLLMTDIHHQILEQQDEQIYQAVLHFVPNVNREELLRALKYDRGQYDKGYADGVAEAVKRGEWEHLGGDEWCCSICGHVITTEGSWEKPTKKYCEECGARMGEEETP